MQHVSKKAKLFDFMATKKRSSASQLGLNAASLPIQVRQKYFRQWTLVICNENRFAVSPLTRKLLTALAGSDTRTCLRPS